MDKEQQAYLDSLGTSTRAAIKELIIWERGSIDQQDCPTCEWTGQVMRYFYVPGNEEQGYHWTCPGCSNRIDWEGLAEEPDLEYNIGTA